MEKSNEKFNYKLSETKQKKIIPIKPIIKKLKPNAEILKNLKAVLSLPEIQDQFKCAVTKLQADDALPSQNNLNSIRTDQFKIKAKRDSNSVKEKVRTSILQKTANNIHNDIYQSQSNKLGTALGQTSQFKNNNSATLTHKKKSITKNEEQTNATNPSCQSKQNFNSNSTFLNGSDFKHSNSSYRQISSSSIHTASNEGPGLTKYELPLGNEKIGFETPKNITQNSLQNRIPKAATIPSFEKLATYLNDKRATEEVSNMTNHPNLSKVCSVEVNDPKQHTGRRKKKIPNTTNVTSRKHDPKNHNQISVEENDSKLRVEIDPISGVLNYNLDVSNMKIAKNETKILPEMKIKKATINIGGRQTDNYKADILEKRRLSQEKMNHAKISDVNASIFKSPETPPKNRIDDINFQDVFLINEIEEYNNQNNMFLHSEDNFNPNLQSIFTSPNQSLINTPQSPEPAEPHFSGYSPRLIQDLDSNTILKQKSANLSPKFTHTDSSVILPQTSLSDIVHTMAFTGSIDDKSMNASTSNKYMSKTVEPDITENQGTVDAVDFLCSYTITEYMDDDDNLSDSSLDESEILRPEDFIVNMANSFKNESLAETNKIPVTSSPIVIENKILAEDEKINLNLCLGIEAQMESIDKVFKNKANSSKKVTSTESISPKKELQTNVFIIDYLDLPYANTQIEANSTTNPASNDKNSQNVESNDKPKPITIDTADKFTANQEIIPPNTTGDDFAITCRPDLSSNASNIEPVQTAKAVETEKPKAVPISRRPRLKGSKINLVQRRKAPVTANNTGGHNMSMKPDKDENPSISPHPSIKAEQMSCEPDRNMELNKTAECINENSDLTGQLQENDRTKVISDATNESLAQENQVDKSMQVEDTNTYTTLTNDQDCEMNSSFQSSDQIGMPNEVVGVDINQIDTAHDIESNLLCKSNDKDESNESDITSKSEFNGFDLSFIKTEEFIQPITYNAVELEMSKSLEADSATTYAEELASPNKSKIFDITNTSPACVNMESSQQLRTLLQGAKQYTPDNVSLHQTPSSTISNSLATKKRQRALTSDSDSFGEDDSMPLKKRPIRSVPASGVTSASCESDSSMRENKITILEKREYFSTRNDSETSTNSDYHQLIAEPSICHKKASQTAQNNESTEQVSKSDPKLPKEAKKNSVSATTETASVLKKDRTTNKRKRESKSDNATESTEKPSKLSSKKSTKNAKNQESQLINNSLDERMSVEHAIEIEPTCSSTPLPKGKKTTRSKKNEISLKKNTDAVAESNERSVTKEASRKNQTTIDSFLLQSSTMETSKSEAMNSKAETTTVVKNKRGSKSKKAEESAEVNTISNTAASSKSVDKKFDKLCKELYPKFKEKSKKPSASNSMGQRKLHPNLLLISNRCDIDSFKVEEEVQPESDKNSVVCGFCKKSVPKDINEWRTHLQTHYGIGWIQGDESFDVTQYNLVLRAMIYYMKVANCKSFTCRMCSVEMKSAQGILSHISGCGLSEEEKLKEIQVKCEICNEKFHYLVMQAHTKTCAAAAARNHDENRDASDQDAEDCSVVLSNTGRKKRKTVVKAELKFKEMEKDEDQPVEEKDIPNYVKTYYPLRGAFFRRMKKNFVAGGEKVKCLGEECFERFDSVDSFKAHALVCPKVIRLLYTCAFCKFKDVDDETVKQHVLNKHEKALKNINVADSGSEIEFSKNDLSESSDECSSGVDETEIQDFDEEDEDADDGADCGKRKKEKKQSNKRKSVALNTSQKVKSCLPTIRSSFVKVAKSVFEWMKLFVKVNHSSNTLFASSLPHCVMHKNVDASQYAPTNQLSMKFSFSSAEFNSAFGSSKLNECFELEYFKTFSKQDEHLIYIGGPITTMEWVPLPDSVSCKSQYLALSYKPCFNKYTKILNPKPLKTLILIYKLSSTSKDLFSISNFDGIECAFHYGIMFDNGPVHDMKFLPSGGYDTSTNRLGLLAVANIDTSVNIYSLPIEANQYCCDTINSNLKLIDLKPVMKLTTSYGLECSDEVKEKKDHYIMQCNKIVWSEANGHKMLATGYVNGFVALWNIETECNLNCFRDTDDLDLLHFTPLNYFRVTEKFITGLDFHYDHKEPRWLVASSNSRVSRVYDIEDPANPIMLLEDVAKAIPTASKWPLIWENIISGSSSDLCIAGPLIISPMQLLFKRVRCGNIPTGVTCLDFNSWQNISAYGCENGDFCLELRSEYNLDCSLKRYLSAKIFTYTDLVRLDGSNHVLLEPPKPKKKNQNQKEENVNNLDDIKIEVLEPLPECAEPLQFFDKEYKNKFGLIFGPFNLTKTEMIGKSEKRNPQFNLDSYVRINSVACNPNRLGSNLYTIGYENGFVRIFNKKQPTL